MTEIDMDEWTRFTDYRGYEKTGPGDRVVLGVVPLVACGAQGAPAPIHDGHLARAHPRLQGSPGQRRPTPLYDREDQGPERPPRSHRCFNRLYLPPYEDYESLEGKSRFATNFIYFGWFRRIRVSLLSPLCFHFSLIKPFLFIRNYTFTIYNM